MRGSINLHEAQGCFVVVALGAIAFALSGCGKSAPPELSGTYYGSAEGRPYTVTFLPGHACRLVSPSNGETFSGTYTIEGKTTVVDFGFSKEIYEIVDDATLNTTWQGRSVVLKKR